MLKKLYTMVIILFPILSIYSINISTITLSDISMALVVILIMIKNITSKNNENINVFSPLVLTSVLIFFHMLILFLYKDTYAMQEIALTTLRYIVYLLFVGLFTIKYFDIGYGWRLLKKVTLFSTIYIIIQYILMRAFGYYLSGFVPGLPLIKTNYLYKLINRYYILENLNRPYSIFEEPSHYALYVLLYLGIALFSQEKGELPVIVLVIGGIIISQSATGYIIIAILLMLFLIQLLKRLLFNKDIYKFIKYIFVIGIGSQIVLSSYTFESFMLRLNNAFLGRVGNGVLPITMSERGLIDYFFGEGMIKLESYIPAVSRVILYFGVIGLFGFILIVLNLIITRRKENRIVILMIFISIFGTELIFGRFIVLYLPFAIIPMTMFSSKKQEVRNEKNSINY